MATTVLTPKQAVLECVEKRRRIPELESTILGDPIAACYYAKHVVKGRWEAGEPVIARKLHGRLVDFNILDEDTRSRYPGFNHPIGPRPKGTEHVPPGNALRLLVVYMNLVKCRVPAFEKSLKEERWGNGRYDYCQMVYRHTGELIDLDSPEVCAWMIRDIAFNKKAKKLSRAERIRVCNELHNRMILHSFAKGDNRQVVEYFKEYKRSENHFLIMLSQQDENLTVAELIRKMTGES
jgi:hypothetical protein